MQVISDVSFESDSRNTTLMRHKFNIHIKYQYYLSFKTLNNEVIKLYPYIILNFIFFLN